MTEVPIRRTIEQIREVSRGLMDPEFALRTFEFAWDAQIVVNEDAKIQFVNTQAELLFGYPRADLYDQHVNNLLPEAIRDKHIEHLQSYFGQPRVRPMGENLALKARHRNGNEFSVLIYLVPMVWHQGLLVVATIRKK